MPAFKTILEENGQKRWPDLPVPGRSPDLHPHENVIRMLNHRLNNTPEFCFKPNVESEKPWYESVEMFAGRMQTVVHHLNNNERANKKVVNCNNNFNPKISKLSYRDGKHINE